MGRTHQSHNIPWQVLAEIYELEPERWNLPGAGKTGGARLRLRRDWDADRIYRAMRHFARKLAKAIEEFAATESRKLSLPDVELDDTGKPDLVLYDNGESIDAASMSVHEVETSPYRTLKGWIDHQRRGLCQFENEKPAKLANGLLSSDSRWQSLVVVAQHGFPFHRGPTSLHWCFDYDDYLAPYILVNLATAIDPAWLSKPVHTWLQDVRPDSITSRHYSTRCHERFFFFSTNRYANVRTTEVDGIRCWTKSHFCYSEVISQLYRTLHKYDNLKSGPDLEAGLPGYLSLMFRCLYRYHVVMMHCGVTRVNWELAVLSALPCWPDNPELRKTIDLPLALNLAVMESNSGVIL